MKSISRLLLLAVCSIAFTISCQPAVPQETAAPREVSIDTVDLERTPIPTPTLEVVEDVAAESGYPIAEPVVEVEVAYPIVEESVVVDEAYPVEQSTISNGAADADVTFVRVVATAPNTYTFHVTVAHPDTGWEDYADGWNVVLPDGSIIGASDENPFTRLLAHPHETEQPFTRSQSNIVIPGDITMVTVQAHDLVNGFGGEEVIVDLSVEDGENFTVER